MKKNITLFTGILFAFVISFSMNGKAQTSGTLTFNVNPVSHNSTYGTAHLVAIWVQNVSNTFIKTKYKMSNNSNANAHLAIWKAASAGSIVDATSGASLSSYAPISVTWNATNVSSAVVPDGIYRVLVEFAWGPSTQIGNGKDTMSVTFNKATNAVHLTPADQTNFTGIVLDWAPLGVSVQENAEINSISVSPNPSSGLVDINFKNEINGCMISVYALSGNLVYN